MIRAARRGVKSARCGINVCLLQRQRVSDAALSMMPGSAASRRSAASQQRDAADDQYRAQEQNPRLRRQKESAYGHDAKYDKHEADILSLLVIADRLLLFAVFIISHNLHPDYPMRPAPDV